MRGDNAAAEAALTQAAERAGTNPAFHRRLSEVLSRRGDQQGALYWAERAISDFPSDPAGLVQLGNLHLAAARLDEAEAAYTLASELATTPAQALGPLHRLSDVATRRNDIRTALAWSEKAIERAPREPGAHNHLAGLHLTYGNLAAAEGAAQKAVEVAPTDVGALRRLSDIALRQGRIMMALDLARQAVAANLADAQSHNHETTVSLAAGDHAGAQASVAKALKLAPNDIAVLRQADYLRGLCLDAQECSDRKLAKGSVSPDHMMVGGA
jgi:tetratricopeptide (TPR) repeat protein